MSKPLRFHWSMSAVGDRWRGAKAREAQSGIPNMEALIEFCLAAEECGIEYLLTAIGFHRPDPIALATALGMATTKIKFMVACRSGLYSPTLFVQQVNTVAALTGGRICINVVGGHTPAEQRYYGDFLDHDERYRRTDEFLTVCRSLWTGDVTTFRGSYFEIEGAVLKTPFAASDRSRPEIYLGGSSTVALEMAGRHADCLLTMPTPPSQLAAAIRPVLESGTEVGLLVSILARPSHADAIEAAHDMLQSLGTGPKRTHREFAQRSDSVAFTSTLRLAEQEDSEWLTPHLWTGAVPYLGAPAIALVGSYEEVANAILEYKECGVSEFLFMGWPDLDEMKLFHRAVLPLIRRAESGPAADSMKATGDLIHVPDH